ncbi:hypothetical protein PoB_005470900, partial [Plakobranchus ocellatus]
MKGIHLLLLAAIVVVAVNAGLLDDARKRLSDFRDDPSKALSDLRDDARKKLSDFRDDPDQALSDIRDNARARFGNARDKVRSWFR